MFLLYERARVFLARGEAERALADAEEALRLSRSLRFWPRLGILRVLAWAHRTLGELACADGCVEQMRQLEVADFTSLRDRLVAEAEGPPLPDGEVY